MTVDLCSVYPASHPVSTGIFDWNHKTCVKCLGPNWMQSCQKMWTDICFVLLKHPAWVRHFWLVIF